MENRKNIALITTWFPPQKSVATNRMLAFTEYLSEEFDITVFALDNATHSKQWKDGVFVQYIQSKSWVDRLKSNSTDSKLKHKIKTAIRVILSKVTKNPLAKWQKRCVSKLTERHNKKPFDLIISSYAPQETHLAALEFVKKFPNVKWIADMRDEMSKNPGISTQIAKQYREIETEINQYATALTTVSEPILNDFKTLCPDIQCFEEVRNGFNHEFEPIGRIKNDKFTLGYFGTFYGSRKATILFKALENIATKRADFDFEFIIVGASNNFNIPNQFKEKVKLIETMSYEEAIRKMMHMDLNIVLHPRSTNKGVFTGKLFDYISVGRPVLACVDTDDVAAKLVLDLAAGYVAEFDDESENTVAIEKAFDDWLQNKMPQVSEENRLSLHRKNQVYKLSELIKKITA